jgi:cardiolipin synthase
MVGRSRWAPLLEAGARFYEFQPARYHCKYMIVDDCWVTVGSAHFDNRSLRINEEVNLNVLDHEFAAEQTRVFAADKDQAEEITLADWRRRVSLRENDRSHCWPSPFTDVVPVSIKCQTQPARLSSRR